MLIHFVIILLKKLDICGKYVKKTIPPHLDQLASRPGHNNNRSVGSQLEVCYESVNTTAIGDITKIRRTITIGEN